MPGLNLTHQEAKERAATIKPSKYQVTLDLTTGDRVFRSVTRIEFAGMEGAATFADLVADQVYSIKLNGQELSPAEVYQDYRIRLENLAATNVLEVEADCLYMNTGEGMHRSVDPADGEVYLYTQFEVPDARRVYTTFEQPDLKATFQFTVTAPVGWEVFANTPTPVPTVERERATFVFPESEVMSTYITAICAGPYVGVTDEVQSIDGRIIPLGAYCRKSLLDHLEAEDLFRVTKQGFAFFEQAFGVPYPFSKYDQVFAPEYNFGAMENAGLVTFRDQYLPRSKPTAADLESRTTTTLHELAHMWFGDLVTMKWWDDLWLNESFAEYMSYLATAEATQWKDAWLTFVTRKEWGMAQDQKPTTHPIVAEVRDLDDVEGNFDGITYAKGGAVLRQLVEYVGRENFFQGLNRYFHKYSHSNATLADLLAELEATSGRDLAAWSKVWLEEAGVTLLRPEVKVDAAGNLESLAVLQEEFTKGASLKPHHLQVSGYSRDPQNPQAMVTAFSVDVDVVGARTEVPGVGGLARPDLILVNDHDLTYAKVRMDEVSLQTATSMISAISDPLTRKTIVSAAWDMTRDGEMSASQFIQLALEAVECETNAATVQGILKNVHEAATAFTAPVHRRERLEAVADSLEQLVRAATPGSDLQKILVENLCVRAISAAHFDFLQAIYEGSSPLPGLEVNPDLKWQLLIALVRSGRLGEAQISALEAEDPTLTGAQRAARARASIDDDQVRETTWQAITRDTSIPNDTRWQMALGFWAHVNAKPEAYAKFTERFFADLARLWSDFTYQIASRLVGRIEPSILAGYVTENIPQLTRQWLDEHTDQPDALRRLILESESDQLRMLNAQKVDAAS